MRRLILLRHAKAEPAGGVPDIQRPLALTGRSQAVQVGLALAQSDLVPDRVAYSASVRTRQTWELLSSRLGEPSIPAVMEESLYAADVSDVLALVRASDPEAQTLLVIGHEPTMAATAAYLADVPSSDSGAVAQVRAGVPTATYSVLEASHSWPQWSANMAALT